LRQRGQVVRCGAFCRRSRHRSLNCLEGQRSGPRVRRVNRPKKPVRDKCSPIGTPETTVSPESKRAALGPAFWHLDDGVWSGRKRAGTYSSARAVGRSAPNAVGLITCRSVQRLWRVFILLKNGVLSFMKVGQTYVNRMRS